MILQSHARRRAGVVGAPGFTLLEVMISITIAAIAIVGSYSAFIAFDQMRVMNRSKLKAVEAAKAKLEEMNSVGDIIDIFTTYKAAAESNFTIAGLNARDDDADGMAGQIVFPMSGTALSETADVPELSMPQDLNLDGDAADAVVTDYVVLPVMIEIEWKDASGDQSYRLVTMLRTQ